MTDLGPGGGRPETADITLTRRAAIRHGARGRRFVDMVGLGAGNKDTVAVWTVPKEVTDAELAATVARLIPGAGLTMEGRWKTRSWTGRDGAKRTRSEFHSDAAPFERTLAGPTKSHADSAPEPTETAEDADRAARRQRDADKERRRSRPGMARTLGSHAANVLQHATPHADQDEPQHLAAITAHIGRSATIARMVAGNGAEAFAQAKEDAEIRRTERLDARLASATNSAAGPKPSRVPLADLDTSAPSAAAPVPRRERSAPSRRSAGLER